MDKRTENRVILWKDCDSGNFAGNKNNIADCKQLIWQTSHTPWPIAKCKNLIVTYSDPWLIHRWSGEMLNCLKIPENYIGCWESFAFFLLLLLFTIIWHWLIVDTSEVGAKQIFFCFCNSLLYDFFFKLLAKYWNHSEINNKKKIISCNFFIKYYNAKTTQLCKLKNNKNVKLTRILQKQKKRLIKIVQYLFFEL